MLDLYLDILQEEEKEAIKQAKGFVYLFHGTKTPIEKIKRKGLTVSDNGSTEARVPKKGIWFTSSKRYAGAYTRKGHIFSKKIGVVLLCKLDKRFLKFVERPLNLFDEYVYFKNIPPKDIKIVGVKKEEFKSHPYLKG